MSAPSIFIWVQHLFGLGHVRRMARIVDACISEGMAATVAVGGSGGREVFRDITRARVHQLPPLKTSDHQYTGLIAPNGEPPDSAYWAKRQEVLLDCLASAQPDILLTELFPFGRRKFADEVLALIKAAKAMSTPPLVISSVRDIVEPKADPAKTVQMAGWLHDHFDAVLVHGDERVIALEATAPFVARTYVPLHYTGYVTPDANPRANPRRGVVVSAGSGASGAALLQTASEAAAKAATEDRPWHIFVPTGVLAPETTSPFMHIHPFTDQFTTYLAQAKISISEAGYNTVAEALALGAKPVLVPYSKANQTEQTVRAKAFAAMGLAVSPADLSAADLIAAIEAAGVLTPTLEPVLDLSGAQHTAVILKDLHSKRAAS